MEISVGQASYRSSSWEESKSKTIILFEERPVPDAVATKRDNAPRFKMRTYITKLTPGDRLLKVERYANDQDKIEFPAEWAAFQKKQEVPLQGTPIDAWPPLNRAQVMEMKAVNIFTVEQLADLSDAHVQKFMGGQMFRTKARDFIKASRSMTNTEDLEKKVKELTEMVEQLKSAKKPGRPRKVKDGADTTTGGNGSM